MPLHFEETRQQPPRDFGEEMCELENETIAKIYELCERHQRHRVLTTAVFVSHVISAVTLEENNELEEPEEGGSRDK